LEFIKLRAVKLSKNLILKVLDDVWVRIIVVLQGLDDNLVQV